MGDGDKPAVTKGDGQALADIYCALKALSTALFLVPPRNDMARHYNWRRAILFREAKSINMLRAGNATAYPRYEGRRV